MKTLLKNLKYMVVGIFIFFTVVSVVGAIIIGFNNIPDHAWDIMGMIGSVIVFLAASWYLGKMFLEAN